MSSPGFFVTPRVLPWTCKYIRVLAIMSFGHPVRVVCEFSLFVVRRETCSTINLAHAAGHSLRSGQAAVSNADDEVSNPHTSRVTRKYIKQESGEDIS